MFEKLAQPVKKTRRTKSVEMPKTIAFLRVVVAEGCRLSYGGLAQAARTLKEDASKQILGQRGSTLTKQLPAELQPFVCQKSGGYAKGIEWTVETPADLRDRPVLTEDEVPAAIKEAAKAAKAAEKKEEQGS